MPHAMLALEGLDGRRVGPSVERTLENVLEERGTSAIGELVRVAKRRDRVGSEHVLDTLGERLIRSRIELLEVQDHMREILSHVILDLEQFYAGSDEPFTERVQYMFRSNPI